MAIAGNTCYNRARGFCSIEGYRRNGSCDSDFDSCWIRRLRFLQFSLASQLNATVNKSNEVGKMIIVNSVVAFVGIVGLSVFAFSRGIINSASDFLLLLVLVVAGVLAGYGLWLRNIVAANGLEIRRRGR